MISITPTDDTEDKIFLNEIFKSSDGQIDAKRYLSLMTRRPFSSMLKDISEDELLKKENGYTLFFQKFIGDKKLKGNKLFYQVYEVPSFTV